MTVGRKWTGRCSARTILNPLRREVAYRAKHHRDEQEQGERVEAFDAWAHDDQRADEARDDRQPSPPSNRLCEENRGTKRHRERLHLKDCRRIGERQVRYSVEEGNRAPTSRATRNATGMMKSTRTDRNAFLRQTRPAINTLAKQPRTSIT